MYIVYMVGHVWYVSIYARVYNSGTLLNHNSAILGPIWLKVGSRACRVDVNEPDGLTSVSRRIYLMATAGAVTIARLYPSLGINIRLLVREVGFLRMRGRTAARKHQYHPPTSDWDLLS